MYSVAEKIVRFEPISREKLKLEVKIQESGARKLSTALHKGDAFIELRMGGDSPPSLRVKLHCGAKVHFQTINHVLRRLGVTSFYKDKGQLHHDQQVNQADGRTWFEVKL